MGIKLISAPAVEPLSLSDAKDHLIISDSLHDDLINSAITAARDWVEIHTGRCLINQTWEIALDEFPAEIELVKIPVSSITSVKYIDSDGVEQTITSTNYGIDDYSPRHWLIPASGYTWPSTLDSANAVKVRYVAGYGAASTDVPAPIIQALKLLVGDFMENRENTVIGVSVSSTDTVKMLLAPYRVLAI
jgi:uncharacterized phiE125 gp8 family phage protein